MQYVIDKFLINTSKKSLGIREYKLYRLIYVLYLIFCHNESANHMRYTRSISFFVRPIQNSTCRLYCIMLNFAKKLLSDLQIRYMYDEIYVLEVIFQLRLNKFRCKIFYTCFSFSKSIYIYFRLVFLLGLTKII